MSSGFISEAMIAEQRKLRQEEWERVRSADQPLEVPEETYDPRSLYERLQEQKNKRDIEYEEAHKLKNMIKGLDDDEVEFLDLVDRTKLEEERKKNLEEAKEMRDFKAAVASLQEKTHDERLKHELRKPVSSSSSSSSGGLMSSSKNSQLKLLAGVLVKKNESKGKKRKLSETPEDQNPESQASKSSDPEAKVPKSSDPEAKASKGSDPEAKASKGSDPEVELSKDGKKEDEDLDGVEATGNSGALKCIGILPGLGSYEDSSDSICSSDSDHSEHSSPYKFDLLGRKIEDPKDKEKS